MTFLTKLEELFMLAVFHHNGPAGLMDIREYLLEKTGKDWAVASLYIALDKLKKKGFVQSFKGEPKQVRGGKALRYYQMTKRGIEILEEAWQMQEGMWNDFSTSLKEKK
ncbi:MAG: PadR family transcriptional regulator [Candidatus Aminicenantes bacterium]|nr:PadR family transcriptional regulator [Candidatus Aminicenantes bacterium]